METLISVLPVYFFIIIGLILKKSFKEKIDEKSYVILSFYFLQPILVFWGLTRAPIDYAFIMSPIIYLYAVLSVIFFLIIISKRIFTDSKDRTIFIAISLVGNTGNIGVPLGIALFGEQSVAYTSIINIANMFFIYIFSIYFFAKDTFTIKKSVYSILKLPGLWVAFFAIGINYFNVPIHKDISKVLEMGAYSSMVIQLIIFGVYLSEVKIKTMNWKLSLHISLVKHFILPIVGIFFVLQSDLSSFVGSVILMQLMIPLAVNNVNLAALYNCKPHDVTASVLISTITFSLLLYFYIHIIKYFLGDF
ncbi:permease [Malaciobacter molluscorum]|uniref:AEC family transporter n=1 Tax=Malaciobacter molluscorum TaxID=1032072 RepID=UPI00100BE670|nr:AEC family transporter [Malaciobacter molluscorum]RXJ93705.1 permease [Malaciobacter molluscorum]